MDGINVLDPDMLAPVEAVKYYARMTRHFEGLGYVAGRTLWGFPYDFRQSNRAHGTLDALEARLERASAANGGRRVDVVSHSMGGLVVKALAALRPAVFERLVRKWVTVATPFQGAPGYAMDALTSGAKFVEGWEAHFFVQRETFRLLAAQSPAMYELVPPPGAPLARACGACRGGGCAGACVAGHAHDGDASMSPAVTLWVRRGSDLHRMALTCGAAEAPGDGGWEAVGEGGGCPCCLARGGSGGSRASSRRLSYKDAVVGEPAAGPGQAPARSVAGGGGGAAPAPPPAPAGRVPASSSAVDLAALERAARGRAPRKPGARKGGPARGRALAIARAAESAAARPKDPPGDAPAAPGWCPRCEVHVGWARDCPRCGVSVRVSAAGSGEVDLEVRVGRWEGGAEVRLGGEGGSLPVSSPPSQGSGGDGDGGDGAAEGVRIRLPLHGTGPGAGAGAPGSGGGFLDFLALRMSHDSAAVPGTRGARASLPMARTAPSWAAETRAVLEGAELPASCQFFNVCGFGHPTPVSVEYGREGAPLGAAEDLGAVDGTFTECEGDGVVPLASAFGDGLRATARLPMRGTHRGILTDPAVMRVVSDWITCDVPAAGGQ